MFVRVSVNCLHSLRCECWDVVGSPKQFLRPFRVRFRIHDLQGYLTHKKQHRFQTLQKGYAWGPMVVLGRWAVSYERGTPVPLPRERKHLERLKGLLPESQHKNLAVLALFVPSSLDSGNGTRFASSTPPSAFVCVLRP